MRFGIRNQFLDRMNRQRSVHRQEQRRRYRFHDWYERLADVVRQRLVKTRVNRQLPSIGSENGKAVWTGAGDEAGRNDAAGTRLVLNHHRLAELDGQLLSHQPRDGIHGTARCHWRNQVNRFLRKILRKGRGGAQYNNSYRDATNALAQQTGNQPM